MSRRVTNRQLLELIEEMQDDIDRIDLRLRRIEGLLRKLAKS